MRPRVATDGAVIIWMKSGPQLTEATPILPAARHRSMPSRFFIAVAQCMLPSPISVKCVSTPSAAKAWASASGYPIVRVSVYDSVKTANKIIELPAGSSPKS